MFRYNAVHRGLVPKEYFQVFIGVILPAAFNVYDALYNAADGPFELNCWAHARRHFYTAHKRKFVNHALVGMDLYNKLFEMERDIAPLCSKKEQTGARQRSTVVVARLFLWKDVLRLDPSVTAGTLRAALNVVTNQWNGLTHFLSDELGDPQQRFLATIALDCGRVGQSAFRGKRCERRVVAHIGNLMASAELQRLNPYAYLRYLFWVLPVLPKPGLLDLAPLY